MSRNILLLTAMASLAAGCSPAYKDTSRGQTVVPGTQGQPSTTTGNLPFPELTPRPDNLGGAGSISTAFPDADVFCSTGDSKACTMDQLADPVRFKQVVVMPAGFTSKEAADFKAEFFHTIQSVTNITTEVYSSKYRSQILYIGYFVPGGALNTPESSFGAKVFAHPIRGKALTLSTSAVMASLETLRTRVKWSLKPWSVLTIFNSFEDNVTANTSPPSFLDKPYGIARFSRIDLNGHYVAMHEMAHGSLNFLDEYVEGGLEETSISSLDALTPLAILNDSWGGWIKAFENLIGMYEYKISETIAAAGNDNIDVTNHPSRVSTPGYTPNDYEYEGGMFFGRGTYHDRGSNIMNGNNVMRAFDDGYDYAHSGSQKEVVKQAFESPNVAGRPNDRIRNAGPLGSWRSEFGSTSHVMLYDGDKAHRYHPTQTYDVQVGWYDRKWKVCFGLGFVPYPCYDNVWKTAQKSVPLEKRYLEIKTTSLFGLAQLAQSVACKVGFTEFGTGGKKFNLCELTVEQMADAFLPSLVFQMPYQDVSVPSDQWFTTYYWHFRTNNGTFTSGWTGWTSFYRVL
jgi:hypothetical protein